MTATDPRLQTLRVELARGHAIETRPDPPATDGVKSAAIVLVQDGTDLHSIRLNLNQLRRVAMVAQLLVDQLEAP